MKFNMPQINFKNYNFDCIKRYNIAYNMNFYECQKCKENFYECWKSKLKQRLRHECLNNNAIKYLHKNTSERCPLCNKLYEEIITGEDGKVEFYCKQCNSVQNIELSSIKSILNEEFEEIDEAAFNNRLNSN